MQKALRSGADAVIADLEDAVAPNLKAEARSIVSTVFRHRSDGAPLRLIRINAAATPDHEADLAAVRDLGIDGVVLPKATAESVAALSQAFPLVALIESAPGLSQSSEIAATSGVVALMLGNVDLGVSLQLRSLPDGRELLFARSKLVLDSATAGLAPPFDGVFTHFRDDAGLEREARIARSLGFGGKACIHPAQVSIVNEVFSDDLVQAREIVSAYDEAVANGLGSIAYRGMMIDRAVAAYAQAILDRAAERHRPDAGLSEAP